MNDLNIKMVKKCIEMLRTLNNLFAKIIFNMPQKHVLVKFRCRLPSNL